MDLAAERLLEDFALAVQDHARHILRHGGQVGVVINPHMARLLSQHGWDKNDIKLYLYENVRVPMRSVPEESMHGQSSERWPRWFESAGPDTLVPFVRRPDNYLILCCGDAYSAWGAVLDGWGYMGGYAHSKRIRR
jgi:hypothetical protein